MPVERSAGAVVYRETKKGREYLLLQHHAGKNTRAVKRAHVGHWDFPKGHIDAGEKTEDTVRREVREETGITRIELIPGFKETIRYFVHPVRVAHQTGMVATEKSKKSSFADRNRLQENSNGVNYTQEKRLKFVAFFLASASKKKVNISWDHQG